MKMGTSLSEQASSLLYAVLLGVAAALLYDLLRALRLHRRRSRALTGVLDAVYCAVLALLAFAFSLRIGGGELRLYMLLAALCGAAVWFALIAPLLRPLWTFWAETFFALLRLLRLPFYALKSFYGKLTKLCKRLFLFSRNCFIIKAYERSARQAYRKTAKREGQRHGKTAEKTNQSADRCRDRAASRHHRHGTAAHAGQDRGGAGGAGGR